MTCVQNGCLLIAVVKKFCEQQGLRLCEGREALFPAMVLQKNLAESSSCVVVPSEWLAARKTCISPACTAC